MRDRAASCPLAAALEPRARALLGAAPSAKGRKRSVLNQLVATCESDAACPISTG